jgi:uncharacterized SAM-binding protein YcdF (DUF218 family)
MTDFLKIIGYLILIPLLALAIGFFFFNNPFLLKKNIKPKERLDAIVVLTGDRGRIDAAVDLMHQNLGKKLFISGVNKKVSLKQMKKMLEDKKISQDKVEFGYKSENTLENALEVREFMQAFEYQSMYLVSSDYHMKRVLLEFRHAMPDVKIVPYFTSTKERKWNKFISEYIKYLRSVLRLELKMKLDLEGWES